MHLIADTNIVALAVQRLRADGHNIVYVGERDEDPGDSAILSEAHTTGRVLLTKDHDLGTLVFRDHAPHAGILLIDDLGSSDEETSLLLDLLGTWGPQLTAGAFVRAGKWGSKIADNPLA